MALISGIKLGRASQHLYRFHQVVITHRSSNTRIELWLVISRKGG